MILRKIILATVFGLLWAAAGQAEPVNSNCRNTGSFEVWLANFKREAEAQGISRRTISAALDGVTLDQSVINKDRGQGVFAQDFLTFSGRMVEKSGRIAQGQARMRKYADIFARIEKDFGVPAAVITGFWGLETDFGANSGNSPVIRSIATLAYDCRRPEMFREQLMAALKIVERGDLAPSEMIGAWAGEIGQMQFVPKHYLDYGVDYDHDGKVDLRHSVPDVLASTANLLKGEGWRRGEPWLEEVRVPAKLPWQEADLSIQHPRSQWAEWGVTRADGQPLKADSMPASLVLPMGRFGPAFLAYDNFKVYLEWNQSLVYSTTAAYFATRLAGAPALNRGNGEIPALSQNDVKQLQQILAGKGFDVGKIDGVIGLNTRSAVKQMQMKYGLPADSYPTAELLERLR